MLSLEDKITNQIKVRNYWKSRKFFRLFPILFTCVFIILPVILFFIVSPFLNIKEAIGNVFIDNIFNSNYIKILGTSASISLASSILSTGIGFILAYFWNFTRHRNKLLFLCIIVLCFILNPTIQYNMFSNAIYGIINLFKLYFPEISIQLKAIEYLIVIVTMSYHYIPIVFFISLSVLTNLNATQIETAFDMGANCRQIFFQYILKQSKYAIFSAMFIVFMLSIGEIAIPMQSKISNLILTTQILNDLTIYSNITIIVAKLLPLFIITLLAIRFYNDYFTKYHKYLFFKKNTKIPKYKCVFMGKGKIIKIISWSTILFPIIAIIFTIYDISNYNITKINIPDNIWTTIINQLIIAAIATFIAVLCGSMIAISISNRIDIRKITFTKYTHLLLLINEVLIINALIYTTTNLFQINQYISTILGLGCTMQIWSAIFIHKYISKIDLNLENASIELGANYIQAPIKITLKIIAPAIISCSIIIFAFCINNFTIIHLLAPNINTFATTLFQYRNIQPIIDIASLILMLTSIIFIYLSKRLLK